MTTKTILEFGVALEEAYDRLFEQKYPAGHGIVPHINEVFTVIDAAFQDVAENPLLLGRWLNFQKKCLESHYNGPKAKFAEHFLSLISVKSFDPHESTNLFFENLQKQGLRLLDLIPKELLKETTTVKKVDYQEDPTKQSLGKIFTTLSKRGNAKLGNTLHYANNDIVWTNGHVLVRTPKLEKIEGVFDLKGNLNKEVSTPAYKNIQPKDFIFTRIIGKEKLFRLYTMIEKLNKTQLFNCVLGGISLLIPTTDTVNKGTLEEKRQYNGAVEVLFDSNMLLEMLKIVFKLGFQDRLELGVAYATLSPVPKWYSLTLTNNLETFEQSAMVMSYSQDYCKINPKYSRIRIDLDTLEFEICEGNGENNL